MEVIATARWNKPDIPHKGWEYVGIEDLGEDAFSGEEIEYEQCEMCGHEKIRYVHILKHPEVFGEFRVGCDCASKMTENYRDPAINERDLKNRTNRRQNFLKQVWRRTEKGNLTLRYKGENITIARSKYDNWGVVFQGEWRWDYHGKKMSNIDEAKLVAFDLFDELHGVKSQVQPYWDGQRWLYY